MSNGLDPDQARRNFGPDLGPNCLQTVQAGKEQKRIIVSLTLPPSSNNFGMTCYFCGYSGCVKSGDKPLNALMWIVL